MDPLEGALTHTGSWPPKWFKTSERKKKGPTSTMESQLKISPPIAGKRNSFTIWNPYENKNVK